MTGLLDPAGPKVARLAGEVRPRYRRHGAWVWKNGVRLEDRENAAPYHRDSDEGWGYRDIFEEMILRRPVHAVLGSGAVKFCINETAAELYVARRGASWELDAVGVAHLQCDSAGYVSGHSAHRRIERDGMTYLLAAETDWWAARPCVTIALRDADGSLWRAVGGWMMGPAFTTDVPPEPELEPKEDSMDVQTATGWRVP